MEEQEPTVRLGQPQDMDAMMELAMMATDENAFCQPSVTKMATMIWGALTRQNGIVGIVSADGKTAHGAILMTIGEPWYSDQKLLEERAIFVHPDYRKAKGGLASRLCDFARKVSDDMKMPLFIGILSNQRTEVKGRLYRRYWGAPAGVFFLHGAKTGEWSNEVPDAP